MSVATLLDTVKEFVESDRRLGAAPPEDEAARQRLSKYRAHALDRVAAELRACRGDRRPQPGSIRRILVAFDASDQATWALRTAVRLAEETGAEVGVIHVVSIEPAVEPAFSYEPGRRLRREAGMYLVQQARSVIPERHQGERFMPEGFADREIVEAAKKYRADLIVMGTHARGRVAQFLLGSVAESVIRTAPCPVLCVAHDPAAPARAAEPAEAAALAEGEAAAPIAPLLDPDPAPVQEPYAVAGEAQPKTGTWHGGAVR